MGVGGGLVPKSLFLWLQWRRLGSRPKTCFQRGWVLARPWETEMSVSGVQGGGS